MTIHDKIGKLHNNITEGANFFLLSCSPKHNRT